MNILSYKGPRVQDPLTESLSLVFEDAEEVHQWWFMRENSICFCANKTSNTFSVCDFPASIVQGHSLYCNEFLWPIFHESGKFVRFDQLARQMFHQFNTFFAQSMLGFDELSVVQPVFITGYHLALAPQVLYNCSGVRSIFFWNLPWPKQIDRVYSPFVSEIALGLLHAHKLGFATPEYASNFLSFVRNALPNYRVDVQGRSVASLHEPSHATFIERNPFDTDFSRN